MTRFSNQGPNAGRDNAPRSDGDPAPDPAVQRRIKDIFYAALDAPEADRETVIMEHCGTDAATAIRVRALLDAHDRAPELLAPAPAPPDGPWIGSRRIIRELGSGGFGIVHLAEETDPIARLTAIKVLRPGIAGREEVARFESERRVLALMNHPSIAQVHEAGETDDGQPYVVMEYVDGPPITTYCRHHTLSIEARVRLIERTALAVHHAHQKGVIHRDIKPSNVLVVDSDDGPIPKVIDFGIAKAFAGPLAADGLTATRHVIGTPQYMPPEQATAGPAVIDTRADVYALGVLLHECLVGRPPFEASRFDRASAADVERIIRDEIPARPSVHAERLADPSVVRRVRGELDWITQRAMEKDPDRRYASAAAMARDLRRWREGDAIDAGPPSRVYRARKLIGRYRLQFAAAAAVLLAIVSGAAATLVYAAQATAARDRASSALIAANQARDDATAARQTAERERTEARREAAKYEAMADFTQGMLTGIDPAVARGADTALLSRMLSDARTRLDTVESADGEVDGTLSLMIGLAYRSIGEYETAIDLAGRAVDSMTRELGPAHELTLEATQALAVIQVEAGRRAEAVEPLRAVHAARAERFGADDQRTIESLSNLGATLSALGRYEEAAELHDQAYARHLRVHGPDHLATAYARNNLAMSITQLGRVDDAIEMLRATLATQNEQLGPDAPRTLSTRSNLAQQLARTGRTDESLSMFDEVIAGKARILRHDHPSLLTSLVNRASVHRNAGEIAVATATLRDVLSRAQTGLLEADPRQAIIRRGLAECLLAGPAPEAHREAEALLAEAWTILQPSAGPEHPRSRAIAELLAGTLESRGAPEAARWRERADGSPPPSPR